MRLVEAEPARVGDRRVGGRRRATEMAAAEHSEHHRRHVSAAVETDDTIDADHTSGLLEHLTLDRGHETFTLLHPATGHLPPAIGDPDEEHTARTVRHEAADRDDMTRVRHQDAAACSYNADGETSKS